jgi:hypothetical protein
VLCRGDEIAYFSPNAREEAEWVVPDGHVDWIFIDRSTLITLDMCNQIFAYLDTAAGTKLAVYIDKNTNIEAEAVRAVCDRADLIFAEEKLSSEKEICQISEDFIKFGEESVGWGVEKRDFITDLTTRCIISASILAALVLGKPRREALLIAKANVENATLNGTLNINKLEDITMETGGRTGPINIEVMEASEVEPTTETQVNINSEIELAPRSELATKEELEA